jgi:hypothetical protein
VATMSVFRLSEFVHTAGGKVVGPAWTDDLSRELLRALRLAAPDASPESDFAVAARVFHEVLSLNPEAAGWPVFSNGRPRHSLFKEAVMQCRSGEEVDALCRVAEVDDTAILLATNVARWMLNLCQQDTLTLVFVSSPVIPGPRSSRNHRPVAAVA